VKEGILYFKKCVVFLLRILEVVFILFIVV